MQRKIWTKSLAEACGVPDYEPVGLALERAAQGLRDTQERLHSVLAEVGEARREIGRLGRQAGEVDARLGRLDLDLLGLRQGQEELRCLLHPLDGRVSRLEGGFEALSEAQEQTNGRLEALGAEAKEAGGRLDSAQTEMRKLERELATIRKRFDAWQLRHRREHAQVHLMPLRVPDSPDTGWSRLIRACGVKDTGELAKQDPVKLYQKMQSVNAKEHLVDDALEKEDAEALVQAAQEESKSR